MTRQEDGSVLYAVYGTLRQGYGNNRLLRQPGVEYLGQHITEPKFTMFGKNAWFPYVAPNGQTPIVTEIYRVTDQEVVENVNGLEGYSGIRDSSRNWYNTCDVETEWGTANMFIMEKSTGYDEKSIITTGDWKLKY